ncbi:MAG: CPBP family intramembrane glutamic endopeptidase [Balneolaceae bacterium]|nr:CPBP family intramembrane glutamic endopeptidase [Balneolaceae bacterium]
MKSGMSSLVAFFVLAFAFSWSVWIPAALSSHGWISFSFPSAIVGLIGAFGPTLSGMAVSFYRRGKSGLGRLLTGIRMWRFEAKWYFFVLLWPALLSLAASYIYSTFGGSLPNFNSPPILDLYPLPPEAEGIGPWGLLPFIYLQNLLIGSAMGEEIGWRGFALPRLQSRMSALSASLVLGVLWGMWHLPLYLTEGHPLSDLFFGWTLLNITADSVLFTWVFNKTQGSLFAVLLFHASIATTGLFLATADESIVISIALKWLIVSVVVLKTGAATLSSQVGHRRNP